MKRWIRTTVLVVLGLMVALLLLGLCLGRVVKAAIETVGPRFTGTPVTVEDVDISPRIGSVTLRGLVVGNPAPYTDPYALRLGEVHVQIDVPSLRSNTVVVRSILVTEADVAFEGAPTHSNIRKLIDTLNQRVGQDAVKPSALTNSTPDRRVRLDEFVIHRMRVRARLSLAGLATPAATLTLPEVRLEGLGSKSAGLTMAELGRDLIQAIYSQVLSALGPKFWLTKETQEGTHWLREKTSGALKDASKAVENLFRKKDAGNSSAPR